MEKEPVATIVICFLGVDGAGKTTVVKALQGEDLGTAMPTVGFSRAEFTLKKHKVIAYDVGGGDRIREIWSTYYAEVYGIVYVVDSAAASRFAENVELVNSLVERPELLNKPILFLLNKKDLPEAIDEMQFSERFQLHEMAKRNKTDIRVEGICAVKGTGKEMDTVISESIEWLIERINANYAQIDKGVTAALKLLRERQAQDRLERQHRLAKLSTYKTEEPSEENNTKTKQPASVATEVRGAETTTVENANSAEDAIALREVPFSPADHGRQSQQQQQQQQLCNGNTITPLTPTPLTSISTKLALRDLSDTETGRLAAGEECATKVLRPASARTTQRDECVLPASRTLYHRSKSLCYANNKVAPKAADDDDDDDAM